MKFKNCLPIVAACFVAASCGSNQSSQKLTSGLSMANLDTTAVPGQSFYQYACGGWMKNNPLPDEYSRFGSFDQLAENNREQVKGLIEKLAETTHQAGSIEQKIGDLYSVAMDSVKLNEDGYKPLTEDLQAIANLQNTEDLTAHLAQMNKYGMFPYFAIYIGADDMNSSMNIVHTYQSGLGMGQRDYYLEEDEATSKIREAYKQHITTMFELVGFTKDEAQKASKDVFDIEYRLAKAFLSPVELRDPHANYNIKTIAELQAEYPSIAWETLFKELGLDGLESIDLGQPRAMAEANALLKDMPLSAQKAYLQWNVINSAASYLSDDLNQQNFEFFGKVMSGTEKMQPRWKRAVSTVNGSLGEAVGQMYVAEYFPPAAKERMVTLVKNLQTALGERIQSLDWMGEATKVKALEKLNTFHVKIGYPDKWKDYSTLAIEKDSYWSNIKRANVWDHAEMIAKAGKPVDKDEWFMTPQTVNAYYNPTTNEICFPAGILQYPFFDMNADDAFNYGAIGVVIGHEMTHGFDDQGRQYDKEGNLKDWWTEEDAVNFEARAKVMSDFFDSIEVAPGVYANGKFTLGENIADHGGLQVSYQAFQHAIQDKKIGEVDGFTPEQRFFLSYANVWADNIRPEEILNRTKMDPHSLGKWRVDGALPHIEAWYKAFNITEDDALFVPKDKRVAIW